jgi:hypothetical protein
VPELEIQERPPSMLKNVDDRPPSPRRGGGGSPSGSKICVINLHRHDRQKVILLMCPILPALSPVMVDDP